MSEHENKKKLIPFFPDYVLDEVIAWYVALALIIVLASLFPAGLEEQADSLVTPEHIKPEWYFLFMYQALKLVPRTIGVLAMPALVGLLIVLPFLDPKPHSTWRKRRLMIVVGVISMIIVVALTVWGIVS